MKVAQCLTLYDPMDSSLPGSSAHGIVQARILELGGHALLQGIFPTQGSDLHLLHCLQILYHLSHQGRERGGNQVFGERGAGAGWA